MPSQLDEPARDTLRRLGQTLVDQDQARIIVPANENAPGFWFGGGNMTEASNGTLTLVGRYRNHGDSRVGTAAGERGLELAVFQSTDRAASFEKVLSFSKSDLDIAGQTVLSIEGSAIRQDSDGSWELFVSTEKDGTGYPAGFEEFLKPRTGVWTIDRLAAQSLSGLKEATAEPLLSCHDPQWLHVKDPFLYEMQDDGLALLFCSHPYSWSSSNTGFVTRRRGESALGATDFEFFRRGTTWDVAMTRGTCVLDVPRLGRFKDRHVSLMFYDGGESLRNLDEHATAVRRPRGYSCEEIGGLAHFIDGDLSTIQRVSTNRPLFVSPHGTGCSRYVDVLATADGLYATWQQSQSDHSQPLVMNFVPMGEVESILAG